MCAANLKKSLSHIIYLFKTKNNTVYVTSIGREFEQQYTTGPQGYKAQAEGQSVGWRAGAQPGVGMATLHG